MANLYVGPDGVIHSGTGNEVHGAVTVNTGNTMINASTARNSTYSSYENISYVSERRKIFFWIFSIIVGILIGLGLNHLVDASIFTQCEAETVQNWFWNIKPWLFVVGGCAGSICYGIFCAEDRNYDLGAFVLSTFSALGGIVAGTIALALIYFAVIIVMYIIGIVIGIVMVIVILAAIIAGFEG